jgi:hypothetical protein
MPGGKMVTGGDPRRISYLYLMIGTRCDRDSKHMHKKPRLAEAGT